MSYTIDERNPERQQLLARILEPHTREVLARLPRMAGARCLDLGCGQGNTTRFLSAMLGATECIGVEYDPTLVEFASTQPTNPTGVSFQRGDVTQLAFPDASFDVVFCRYLLIHLTDPMAGVREMMRVVRPGGYAVAFEADFVAELSDPDSHVLALINRVWNLAHRGRRAAEPRTRCGFGEAPISPDRRSHRSARTRERHSHRKRSARDDRRAHAPRRGSGQRVREVPGHVGDRTAIVAGEHLGSIPPDGFDGGNLGIDEGLTTDFVDAVAGCFVLFLIAR
jgi:SAM-dependent methyltransferase